MSNDFALLVMGLMSILTWAVTRTALRDHSTLSNPAIPLCVAGLSFLSLMGMREEVAKMIAPLYAALAIALLLLLFVGGAVAGRLLGRRGQQSSGESGSITRADDKQRTEERQQESRKERRPPWPR